MAEAEDYGHERASHTTTMNSSSKSRRSTRGPKSEDIREGQRPKRPRASPRERMVERVQEWDVAGEIGPGMAMDEARAGYQPANFVWEAQEQISNEYTVDYGPTMMPKAVRPTVLPPIALPMPTAIPPRVALESPHTQPYVEDYEPGTNQHDDETETITTLPLSRGLTPGRTDYIHICDQYPQIVLEALHQQRQPVFSSSSSSSASSSSTSSIHAITPTYIPRAAFQFAQYPHLQHHLWNPAPTSYPRQWMGQSGSRETGMEPEPLRYAPYARAGGTRRVRGTDRRRLAPSNAPPLIQVCLRLVGVAFLRGCCGWC